MCFINENRNETDPTVRYYDGDYPSVDSIYPENFDESTKYQGLTNDIARYKEIAKDQGNTTLELCCGTGRVAIPLARDGFQVMGVDISEGLLAQFVRKLSRESQETKSRVKLIHQDITKLKLEQTDFNTILIAFNSLLCIPDFKGQCEAIQALAQHLSPKGKLVVDIVNSLVLRFDGDATPKAFYTRRDPHNGNMFTRFALRGAQELFTAQSSHMFIQACRV